MFFRTLSINGLRNIEAQKLSLSPGANFFYGENGAGKSTFLEALFLLANGKSFRGGYRQSLVKEGLSGFNIQATLCDEEGINTELKIIRQGKERRIFLNNSVITNRSELVRHTPSLIFCQESLSALVTTSTGRRALLDWCLFHVEPGYHSAIEQFRVVMGQYNAALRKGQATGALWIEEYARAAEKLDGYRQEITRQIVDQYSSARQGIDNIPVVEVSYRRGWPAESSLADVLKARFGEHLSQGFCPIGPHRADLRLKSTRGDVQNWASRGQVKAYFFLLFMAVIKVLANQTGQSAIVLIDDLWAEFDQSTASRMVDLAMALNGQVFFTSATREEALLQRYNMTLFHVEQGAVTDTSVGLGG